MNANQYGPLNILVVDDSAVVREVMTAVLSQEPGFNVMVAGDPFIAMGKMKNQRPDVIILDLEMPRMDGIETLREITRDYQIPVVVVSAHTREGAATTFKALHMGAFDFVA